MMREEGGYRSQRERERAGDGPGEPAPRRERPRRRFGAGSGQIVVGLVISIVGISMLLDNLGVIDNSGQILRFWPVILIVIGGRHLLAARSGGLAMRGVLLSSIGILFLLNNLDVINFTFRALWPMFLIYFGFQMLFRSRQGELDDDDEVDSTEFDDFAFLGGVKRSVVSSQFRGGAATAFMGGVEIDLHRAKMAGDKAVINVFAMMGGVVLRVPDDWLVESKVVAILGGVDDKTRPLDPTKTLVLKGSAIMGGVEIKD